jgi:hypothetical protein
MRLHASRKRPLRSYTSPLLLRSLSELEARARSVEAEVGPMNHIRDIERPYDLEPFEHGTDLVG